MQLLRGMQSSLAQPGVHSMRHKLGVPGIIEPVGISNLRYLRSEVTAWTRASAEPEKVFQTELRGLTAPGESDPATFSDPIDIATPQISLRTNDGSKFGGSIAAEGDILVLAWGDRGLLSPDANLGGNFYLDYENMWGSTLSNDGAIVRRFASKELGCAVCFAESRLQANWRAK